MKACRLIMWLSVLLPLVVIAFFGKVQHENGSCPDIYFNQRGNRLLLQTRDQEFLLHNHAVGQLADKIGVPAKYLRELSQGPQW